MPSQQLRGHRGAIHTVGVAANGVLYIDIQRFSVDGCAEATTYYVRAADVLHIKRQASLGRLRMMTDLDLVKLFAASFHNAEYALEWLQWAHIPMVRRDDEEAQYNAEDHIPEPALHDPFAAP
jgi:hypothetical protein